MRAMILAAGLGTRIRPLTTVRPKVLIPLMGTTILDYWMWRFEKAGVESVMVNAFHLGQRLAGYVNGRAWPIELRCRIEAELLGTGGGLRNVCDFFGQDTAVVVNGDIICDVSLDRLVSEHRRHGGPVSLLLQDCDSFNNVAVDAEDHILGFGQEARELCRVRPGVRRLAFTGIHVIDPKVLEGLPANRPSDILDLYRGLIRSGRPVRALYGPGMFWREMGSVAAYRSLVKELTGLEKDVLPPLETRAKIWVHPNARIAEGVQLKGFVVAGDACRVMDGAVLEDVILWDRVSVHRNCTLRRCIAADGTIVTGDQEDRIIVE